MSKRRRDPWKIDVMDDDRLSRGWTKRDLARAAGCSEAAVTRFFNGESQAPKMARRLAFALGHPLERYFRESQRLSA